MYSVIRFYNLADRTASDELGQKLESILGEKYDGPSRRNPCCVSFTVSKNTDWLTQQSAITATIDKLSHVIRAVRSSGGSVVVDVLIKRDDYFHRYTTGFGCSLPFMENLLSHGVELEFTVNGEGPNEANESECQQLS
jgi:hypothetical protein